MKALLTTKGLAKELEGKDKFSETMKDAENDVIVNLDMILMMSKIKMQLF